MRSKIVDSNLRGFKAYDRNLTRAVPKAAVAVGVLDPEPVTSRDGSPAGISTGQLMAIHEYGSPERGIPSRPVLRDSLAEQRGAITKILTTALISRAWGSGDAAKIRPRRPLIDVGQLLVKSIKGRFGTSRVKRAKQPDENGPLVDTGHLRRSIKYRVLKVSKDGEVVT